MLDANHFGIMLMGESLVGYERLVPDQFDGISLIPFALDSSDV